MREPDFYRHPVEGPVECIQTHISVVFLAGDFAYKIKKPVNLGFLDFSTLEKRRHYCEEELRLNARFAPDLYLEVVPIYETVGRFALEPPAPNAEPVEYAVNMRRFPQEGLLKQRLKAGVLTREDLRAVAAKLAALHTQAPTNDTIAANGTPEAIAAFTRNELDAIAQTAGDVLSTDKLAKLTEAFTSAADLNRPNFAARHREGCIRECHGDLHLNNICVYHGTIQFFDCIEFNERFRNIDVMYELAFPVMDLEFRGAPQFANLMVNEYLERSGDYSGARLIPFYAALRALVRAKVALIRAAEPEFTAEEQDAARNDADAHIGYALRRLERRTPKLILVCGLSGSGKSAVSRALASETAAIHLRSDAIRKHLHDVPLDETRDSLYTPEATAATYIRMIEIAEYLLESGQTVILDATFQDANHRAKARDTAQRLGTTFEIVHLTAPDETLRQRLDARTHDISDADAALLDQQHANFELFTPEEEPHLIKIQNAGTDIQALVRRILNLLNTK